MATGDIATEPLIHTTTRGHLPVASLKHVVTWRIQPDCIVMYETYTADDGVVVRQDAHVCALKGATLESTPAEL